DRDAVLLEVQTLDPPPISEVVPEVPEPLSRLIGQLLAKKPRQRPSIEAVILALSQLAEPEEEPRSPTPPPPRPSAENAVSDPHLAQVLDAWPLLPSPIRRAILALVKSTTDEQASD